MKNIFASIKTSLILITVIFGLSVVCQGQNHRFCLYNGKDEVPQHLNESSVPLDQNFRNLITELRPYFNISPDFQIYPYSAQLNYAGVMLDEKNDKAAYLHYSEAFFRNQFISGRAEASVYLILCHELAHIGMGHLLKRNKDRQLDELVADSLAGATLAKLGFRLAEIKETLSQLTLIHSETHPSANLRWKYIESGFGDVYKTFPVWFQDSDGDGFGSITSFVHAVSQPKGYVKNASDCCDEDANVFPGQTAFFSQPNECGNFDYDCSGATEYKFPQIQGDCDWGEIFESGSAKADPQGWVSTIPQCGESADWLLDCDRPLGRRTRETETRTQRCK